MLVIRLQEPRERREKANGSVGRIACHRRCSKETPKGMWLARKELGRTGFWGKAALAEW